MRGNKNKMIHNGNTLNDYLIENDRHIGDLVNLFSVGTVLDKVNGETFPMLVGGAIGFDEPMNIMEMEINGDSYEWFESLSDTDKSAVDEVMFNLSYENWVEGHIGEPEYLGDR